MMRIDANIQSNNNQKDIFHKNLKYRYNELPTISIVICTFNSAHYVNKCLKSIFNSDYPKDKIEVICIDDGSHDRTVNELMKYPVKVIAMPRHMGRAKARNLGIEKASKDIILFVDSDSEVDPKTLYYHAVHYCKDPSRCCVSGRIVQVGEPNVVSTCWETMPWIRIQNFNNELINRGILWAPTGNLSFRAEFIKKVLFDEKICGHGEDVDLGWVIAKQGCKLVREKEAIVYHRRKKSLQRLIMDMFSRGRSEITLAAKHKDRTTSTTPSFMTMLLIFIMSTLLLSLISWKYFSIIFIFMSAYVFMDFTGYILGYKTFGYYFYPSPRLRDRVAAWPIYFLWRIAYESGEIYESLKIGMPKLLTKKVCYAEQTPKNFEDHLHLTILIITLVLSVLYLLWC